MSSAEYVINNVAVSFVFSFFGKIGIAAQNNNIASNSLFISPLNLPCVRKVLQSYNKSVCGKVFCVAELAILILFNENQQQCTK